ncbi:MAG: ABC transporter substrate-binding protein [Xanthobacteraceae bacterium]
MRHAALAKRGIIGLLVLVATSAAVLAEAPRRVVSFNICADQLVVALAAPEQVAALSPYATDASLSVVAGQARSFRQVGWHAESTIPLNPDLVLVGPRDRSVTQRLLSALGFRVVSVDFVSSLAAARAQITSLAALLGQQERGDALLAQLDAAMTRLRSVSGRLAATALLVGHAGYTEGRTSLAAALMAEAGLKPPPGAPDGIGGYVPLERLIMLRPDLLVLSSVIEVPHDQGSVYLTHPALRALYPPRQRVILPARYTICGGPALVAGLDHLSEQLARLAGQPLDAAN